MATDRQIIKERQAGQAAAYGLANNNSAQIEMVRIHSRAYNIVKTTSEIANANVAEQPGCTVQRASRLAAAQLLVSANVAQSTSDYLVFTLQKRTAGGGATTIATLNTHNSAQGAIAQYAPKSFSVVANSDGTLAASDSVTFTVTKVGSGQALNVASVTLDLEEV